VNSKGRQKPSGVKNKVFNLLKLDIPVEEESKKGDGGERRDGTKVADIRRNQTYQEIQNTKKGGGGYGRKKIQGMGCLSEVWFWALIMGAHRYLNPDIQKFLKLCQRETPSINKRI